MEKKVHDALDEMEQQLDVLLQLFGIEDVANNGEEELEAEEQTFSIAQRRRGRGGGTSRKLRKILRRLRNHTRRLRNIQEQLSGS